MSYKRESFSWDPETLYTWGITSKGAIIWKLLGWSFHHESCLRVTQFECNHPQMTEGWELCHTNNHLMSGLPEIWQVYRRQGERDGAHGHHWDIEFIIKRRWQWVWPLHHRCAGGADGNSLSCHCKLVGSVWIELLHQHLCLIGCQVHEVRGISKGRVTYDVIGDDTIPCIRRWSLPWEANALWINCHGN